jgi:hypothetical protein
MGKHWQSSTSIEPFNIVLKIEEKNLHNVSNRQELHYSYGNI